MFTPITIVGTLENPDGSLASGGFTFQLSSLNAGVWVPTGMADTSTGTLVTAEPIQAVVFEGQLLITPSGGAGYQPLVLLAVDDPTTTPTGLAYLVTEQLTAGSLSPWPLTVHAAATGGKMNIASQRPVP